MRDITHDPTRGWLLLTEKWPENRNKPISTYTLRDDKEYNEGVKLCLSTAIEIATEDLEEVVKKAADCALDSEMEQVNSVPKRFKLKSHHPYSVDAEFEVNMKPKGAKHLPWLPRDSSRPLSFDGSMEYIARLVKAKEDDLIPDSVMKEGFKRLLKEGGIETESQEEMKPRYRLYWSIERNDWEAWSFDRRFYGVCIWEPMFYCQDGRVFAF